MRSTFRKFVCPSTAAGRAEVCSSSFRTQPEFLSTAHLNAMHAGNSFQDLTMAILMVHTYHETNPYCPLFVG